ncbi:hypothetical protein JX266_013460 [Neoarthrinium moseri]|nr:hypothetical protein JX266_013460 [Neoarthrinium moseri]
MASRAYREKRKQKLALLDQILKTENEEASTSPSESDDYKDTLSIPSSSRDTSQSPVPVHQNLVATTAWPSSSQTLASTASFASEPFENLWMHDYDRNNNLFENSHQFMTPFQPSNGTVAGTSDRFPPSLASVSSLPTMPSISMDPMLAVPHTEPQLLEQQYPSSRKQQGRFEITCTSTTLLKVLYHNLKLRDGTRLAGAKTMHMSQVLGSSEPEVNILDYSTPN